MGRKRARAEHTTLDQRKSRQSFHFSGLSFLVSKGGLFVFVAVNSLKSWAKTQSFCPLYVDFVTHLTHHCQENSCIKIELKNYHGDRETQTDQLFFSIKQILHLEQSNQDSDRQKAPSQITLKQLLRNMPYLFSIQSLELYTLLR